MTLAIVSGAIANKPFNGGEAWVRLSWVLGLKRLGYEVAFIEELTFGPDTKSQDEAEGQPFSNSVTYFRDTMSQFGLQRASALIDQNGRSLCGINEVELQSLYRNARFLINISGHLDCEAIGKSVPIRVYVDLDPGFTQFWHAQGTLSRQLDMHTHFYTVGENIGTRDCSIPAGEIPWRAVRQPVVLDDWPVVGAANQWRFTTIASWRGAYGPVQVGDKTYGLKVHQFRKFIELPRRLDRPLEIALDIHPSEEGDLRQLRENGWLLVDPQTAAGGAMQFRDYIQRSGAEFSVAQGIYVETNSGWFSDRTVRYLASGKPVLVQDTGFSKNFRVGRGLLAFRSMDEAVAGARAIADDYVEHCRASRAIAEEHFDSNKVLGQLLTEVGIYN
jgi:hypothetical protein